VYGNEYFFILGLKLNQTLQFSFSKKSIEESKNHFHPLDRWPFPCGGLKSNRRCPLAPPLSNTKQTDN
jgi:hypothetical protein